MHKKTSAANFLPIRLHLEDNEWPLEFIDHDREIVRAIVFDDDGYFYFVRVDRDDEFGKALLIETSGGGVESGEDLSVAILRELREELGITEAEIVAEIGTVSDYYNQIHRHNINHYFLCRAVAFGENRLTQEEMDIYHLSTLRVTYEQAVKEYELRAETPLGRLLKNRELPVLQAAKRLLDAIDV